jgi:hypothetical protein
MFNAPMVVPPYTGIEIQRVLHKMGNGTAPGWSGWTKELLSAAGSADPQLFENLGEFLAKLQSCTDQRLSELCRAGKLIALDNAKSLTDEPDARPITISELFTKILGSLAMEKSTWNIHIHPCQRGVCHPGGSHQAVYEIQQAYDNNPSKIIGTFDVKNAFNSVLRSAIRSKLESLHANAFHLLEFFRFMYGTQSKIYNRAKQCIHEYESAEGVRQGDMPASLLFSLVFTDAAVFAGSFLTDILRELWLYLDDVTLVATVEDMIRYKNNLSTELSKIGLSLNMKKCRVLCDRCSPEEVQRLQSEGFQIDYGSTRVLGCPVGDLEACKAWVSSKVSGWSTFWERLRNEQLHPLTALTLLSKCGNVKFEHLAKSLHPSVTAAAALQFDTLVSDTARAILGCSRDSVPDYVLRLVLHLKPYVTVGPVLYSATARIAEGFRVNVGIEVTDAIAESYKEISLPPFVGLLLRSAQGSTASDTIRVTSEHSAHDIIQGIRLRCGILPRHVPFECTCGFVFGSSPSPIPTIGHLLTCEHNLGENKTTRHHSIAKAMISVLGQYRLTTIFNQWRLDPKRELIPDMHVLSSKRQVITDLTIVDEVAANSSALLDEAAKTKHEKYDALAEFVKMDFYALPISAYGRLHRETSKFIYKMSEKLPKHRRRDFRSEIKQAIQHNLLVGNSVIIDKALARLCERVGEWVR